MDWLTFIVELTKALAWPLTIVAIITLLRRPILQLIPDIRKFKFGDLEIDIGKELREVEKQAETALPELKEVTRTVSVVVEAVGKAEGKAEVIGQAGIIDTNDRARRLAELSPAAAVVDSWLELETALRKGASANDIAVNEGSNPVKLMKALMNLEKVDRQTYEIFDKLRGIRNRAVHARSMDLTASQALEYREITKRLAAKLLS